jgi:hypothetical protein
MTRPGMRSLLDLPAELRLHIYDYYVPDNPLKVPPGEFSGLLYSCRHMRSELEPFNCEAIAQSIQDIAKDIRDKGDDIIYTPPITFHGWFNLTVSRPMTTYMFICNDTFWEFSDFRFNTFTIAFHNKGNTYEPRVGL